MHVLGHCEATHIAHHHQDMLIDGIDMEQVMLHLPDDTTKTRQIAPKNAGLIHAAQRMRNASRRLDDLQK